LSYLNALASNGLSVGLRVWNPRAGPAARPAEEPSAYEPAESSRIEPVKPPGQTARTEPVPQTPEEKAAGRAEALAQLASAASLGILETKNARSEQSSSKSQIDDEPEEISAGPKELTEEEKKLVQKLKTRDREVKAHEAAHMAASGGLAGSPSYTYETGPDGNRYATGGEVSVHSRGSDDPAQALSDAEAIKRAAEAPASPSSQDRAVAAAASADVTRLKEAVRQEEETEKDEERAEAPAGSLSGTDSEAQPARTLSYGPFNGQTFGQKVSRAYETVKNSFPAALRPVLARV
jgi:hypothetical protein